MSESNLTEKIDNNNTTPSDTTNNNVEFESPNVPKDETSDVSPSSDASSASAKTAASKQSGIRPPSRIGRPCGGMQKPAIPSPSTPTKNSSDDSMKRLIDEYGRHRLTDSSAVLTEDTDSFMIGQRVWVGGTKPGTIAYIGETQFAPGEWAGIALDEPIGKNDGSVGGIKYFQCENKKGVFSRLTRLTRVPLEQPGMGSNETFTSPTNGIRRSPISPTGSTSLLKSAMSLSNSNTSLNSSATHIDFKIGDRVIIKSTQGSKVGTVRYMGLTDFAPGEWVGVELDDPRGKNDGSVAGTRYFECLPNFGLFAPASKVSKSPSKHKPSACVVHSGSGLPPSGIKRANSKESMASLASKTSAASSVRRVRLGVTSLTPKKVTPKTSTSTPIPTRTALQDVLREKQQHIEQLLKERDLERAEITKASTQADDAEKRFLTLKQEFQKHLSECEVKARESSDFLSKLQFDQKEVLNQLEDEKRKNEDLQFKFEEAAITKSDIEVVNQNFIKKVDQLEKELEEERHKTEALESTSNKLFEAEESLIKVKEENETLKEELNKTRKERSTAEEERSGYLQLVESLQKQVEGVVVENAEKTTTISQLNDEIEKVTTERALVKREVEEIQKRAVDNCKEKDEEIKKLKAELDEKQKIIQKYEKTNEELVKENERLKMEISAKSHDVESTTERITAKDNEAKSARKELESVKKELNQKIDDLERHKRNSAKVEEDLRKELDNTREDLKQKISEVENVKKESNLQTVQKDEQLEKVNKAIAEKHDQIEKLSKELTDVKTSFDESKKDIHTRHARQVANQDSQLMALSAELQQKNEEITKSSIVITKLEEDLCTKNGIIEKLRVELESCENQHLSHTESSTALNNKLNEMSLEGGDLRRQLNAANVHIGELLELKQRQDAEIQALSAKCENADQLETFRAGVQNKDKLLAQLREEYELKLQNSDRLRHELELQCQTAIVNFERLKQDLEGKLQISVQSEGLLKQRCDNTIVEITRARDEYRIQIDQLQNQLKDKELALENLEKKANEAANYYQDQLKSVTDDVDRKLQECHLKISSLTIEASQLREGLARKSEELIGAKAEVRHVAAQCEQNEKELKHKYGEDIHRLEFELNERNLALQKAENELVLIRQDCQSSNVDVQAKDSQISQLAAQLQQAQALIAQLQEQLNRAHSLNQEKLQEHELVQNQCQGLLDKVASLTLQVKNGEDLFKNLQIQHNNAVLLIDRLRITEQQKQECLRQLQQEALNGVENKTCDDALDILNKIKIGNGPENTEQILLLQRDVDGIRNQLAERNHQFDVQQNELLRLQQELLRAQESNRCIPGQQEPDSLIQDKELAENQIKFLNTIIVDIQRKNEEQRARIEILEAGCSTAVADELKLISSSERQIPPRMYCDICEEFDLHETEDCPKQTSEVGLETNGHRLRRHAEERPYCEICEEFGHATEDCQGDNTF